MNHTTAQCVRRCALATVLAGAFIAAPVFAVSDPADDAASYSYNEGRTSYETRMAEPHSWYDNTDDTASAAYSFRAGQSENAARTKAFEQMPNEPNLSDEELAAFFEANGIGKGSAYSGGAYDEEAEGSYSFNQGAASYDVYHKPFEN